MKRRIKNLKDIPTNFSNDNYDRYFGLMTNKSISYALGERQSLKWMIDSLFDKNHRRWMFNHEDADDIDNIIIRDKEYYLEFVMDEINDPIRLVHSTEEKDIEKKLPQNNVKTFDDYPFIQPIKVLSEEDQIGFSLRLNAKDWENFPTLKINLDFSDELIITDIKRYLKKIRKKNNHQHKFLPPDLFLKNLERYRTFQLIDLLFWQQLTNQHIQYEVLANFLYPVGEFDGTQLRESIIPFVKKLLDRNSQNSSYVHYLSDRSYENRS